MSIETTTELLNTIILVLNGTWTIENIESGEYRTFEIKTKKFGDQKKRVISLMTGSDNESSFTGFGFVSECGRYINVWKRFKRQDGGRMTKHETYAWILSDFFTKEGARWGHKFNVVGSATCHMCSRKLTTPESVRNSIGPVCAKKAGL